MKKTLLEFLLSSPAGLADSSEPSKPVLKIQPEKGVVRYLPKDFLGSCDVFHSGVRWPAKFEALRPKDAVGCLVLVRLIPQDNGMLAILIARPKMKIPEGMTYKNNKVFENSEGEKNSFNVYKSANSLAEALASGAPEMDELSGWEDENGNMKIYFTESFPSVAMELPIS
jgi:hypothetical protein